MLTVTYKPLMMGVLMLNVVVLSVVAPTWHCIAAIRIMMKIHDTQDKSVDSE
jgi:hypothetical protein